MIVKWAELHIIVSVSTCGRMRQEAFASAESAH